MLSKEKQDLLNKIKEHERLGLFDVDVNDDPPSKELLPNMVDYECKKLSSKCKRFIANFIADRYFKRLIKKDILVIDGIENELILEDALKNGAIITCNHFSAFDNYIVFHLIRKYLPKKNLYKIIREGNYTSFPGLFGFFFRNCNTLPLSSNYKTMMKFFKSCNNLLKQGESILVYPEQAMWWNYKKPRPLQSGAFTLASRNNVPIIPCFITMEDTEKDQEEGYKVQAYTIWFLPPIYPDQSLSKKENAKLMQEKNYEAWKTLYEKVYKIPLEYGE